MRSGPGVRPNRHPGEQRRKALSIAAAVAGFLILQSFLLLPAQLAAQSADKADLYYEQALELYGEQRRNGLPTNIGVSVCVGPCRREQLRVSSRSQM